MWYSYVFNLILFDKIQHVLFTLVSISSEKLCLFSKRYDAKGTIFDSIICYINGSHMRCKVSMPFSKIKDAKGTHYIVWYNAISTWTHIGCKASQITNSMKVKL